MAKSKEKWYKPSKEDTGWHKNDPPTTRRRRALRAHKGNYLSAARSMQALSNVTKDRPTSRVAQVDANYFYKMHEKYGK